MIERRKPSKNGAKLRALKMEKDGRPVNYLDPEGRWKKAEKGRPKGDDGKNAGIG